ncbi:hypothetical protein DPEC_G00338420 [Dallia pectoralis]|uniref:Uncharacterized protein n=1 Tax=Dallia pectoralis TaxID=75939 RepID=A0ACC2F4K2_DALPE|nr:hypothetical protein DPEC_G00338420 [Dallia pectoralis]
MSHRARTGLQARAEQTLNEPQTDEVSLGTRLDNLPPVLQIDRVTAHGGDCIERTKVYSRCVVWCLLPNGGRTRFNGSLPGIIERTSKMLFRLTNRVNPGSKHREASCMHTKNVKELGTGAGGERAGGLQNAFIFLHASQEIE